VAPKLHAPQAERDRIVSLYVLAARVNVHQLVQPFLQVPPSSIPDTMQDACKRIRPALG